MVVGRVPGLKSGAFYVDAFSILAIGFRREMGRWAFRPQDSLRDAESIVDPSPGFQSGGRFTCLQGVLKGREKLFTVTGCESLFALIQLSDDAGAGLVDQKDLETDGEFCLTEGIDE